MFHSTSNHNMLNILNTERPRAFAWITGNAKHPELYGVVKFFAGPYKGIIVEAEIFHLTSSTPNSASAFFGFHIHENGDCSGSFENTGNHYNPTDAAHPFHAGDMPPLMSNNGYAWTAFFDARITIPEILNKSVVIHGMPDDFTTQPSGNAGEKIACGVIESVEASVKGSVASLDKM